MDEMKKIYQTYLDMSDEERNNIALVTMNEIFEYLNDSYDEDTVIEIVMGMFSVLCCADGKISYEEYEMFKHTTGATPTYDEFYEVTKDGTDEEIIDQFFGFVYEEDDDFESNVFVLAVCLFTSKGTLTVEEQEFLEDHLL